MTANIRDVVLMLHKEGYAVIPSGGGKDGKAPIVPWAEYQKKLPSEAKIKQWLKRRPPLWGIVTGKISGVVVVDVDPGADLSIMEGLERNTKTPRKGDHYFFKYPGYQVKTVTGIFPHIDIRGDGGFVNIVGRNKMGEYVIEKLPTRDNLIPWAELPRGIAEAIKGANSPINESEMNAEVKSIPEGQRNNHLTSMAGSMQKAGFHQSSIEAALLKENTERCQPPLEGKEVRQIAKSVARYDTATDKDNKRPRVSTQLLDIVKEKNIELFHTPEKMPYIVIEKESHHEVWALESRTAKDYLARGFYETTGAAPSSQTIQDVITVLRGQALFDEAEEPIYTRLAEHDSKIYLDIGDPGWNVIEITAEGWQVINSSPIRFVRSRGMIALPVPQKNGDISNLKNSLNVTEDDWPLVLAWLLGAFMHKGPFPVLVITGEQGSAKSTVAKMLRLLVDPSTIPLRALPREERDLSISARNTWILAFDNVSYITPWLSDAICRLSTGGGFAVRQLYADAEEFLFASTRPVILNGIGDIATRSDLLDRTIFITLPVIPSDKRRTEEEIWEEFDSMRPKVLGVLLDAVSLALKNAGTISIVDMPRMADFVKWVVAAIPALGIDPSDFLEAYRWNIQDINQLALESSPVVQGIKSLAAGLFEGGYWEGTATDLLERLNLDTDDGVQHRRDWPKSSRALGAILNRLAPNLRKIGIDVTRGRGDSERIIYIRKGKQGYPTPQKKAKRCIVTKLAGGGLRIQMNLGGIPSTAS